MDQFSLNKQVCPVEQLSSLMGWWAALALCIELQLHNIAALVHEEQWWALNGRSKHWLRPSARCDPRQNGNLLAYRNKERPAVYV